MPSKASESGGNDLRTAKQKESEEPLLPPGAGSTVNYDMDAHERRRDQIGPQASVDDVNDGMFAITSR